MSSVAYFVLLILACVALGGLLWPRHGALPRWLDFRRMANRVLTEDALKHCYDCEYAGLPATTTSLAGALEIRRDRAVRLSQRLEAMRLVDVKQRTLCFQLREHVLAPVVAANLTVEPISKPQGPHEPDARLSSLRVGQEATVLDISPACHGLERRRLLDLGMVPGTKVQVELASISGDPLAYRVRGALIALRNQQAELIHVMREPLAAADPSAANKSRLLGPR